MEKGPGDLATARACLLKSMSIGVADAEEWLVGGRLDRRVMEFVAPYRAVGRCDRTVMDGGRQAIAERHPALGETGHQIEQASHGMRPSAGVDQRGAEDHVAAAFAMHGPVHR